MDVRLIAISARKVDFDLDKWWLTSSLLIESQLHHSRLNSGSEDDKCAILQNKQKFLAAKGGMGSKQQRQTS